MTSAAVVVQRRMRARSPAEKEAPVEPCPVGGVERHVDRSDRLLRRAAPRPGDSGDGDADRRAEPPPRTERHLASRLLRDRAEAFERRGAHPDEGGLGRVRVRHRRAEEVVRRPGHLRQSRGKQTSGAGLGKRESLSVRPEEIADGPLQRLAVAAVDVVAESLPEIRLDPVEDPCGLLRRAPRGEMELHLAGAGENGHGRTGVSRVDVLHPLLDEALRKTAHLQDAAVEPGGAVDA